MARNKSGIVVVLGKPSVNKLEHDALITIGRALAKRDKKLVTTKSPGVPQLVIEGYKREGGEPTYLQPGLMVEDMKRADEVLVFTDTPYQKKLDERKPDWRAEGWLVFHNRKATNDAANMTIQILEELGTPLDGGD